MSQQVPTIALPLFAYDMDLPTFYDPLLDFDIDHKMLDGLTGVPTRTTSTLTPTTLRNIEQTFIDLQCQEESHQNQAGFVPPVVQPVSHGSGNSLFMSLIDHKTWGGGSAMVGDSHSSNDSTLSITPPATIPTTTRRNMGGRRPIKDKNISPEEEERRQVRRERNKMAAARCRKRRLDHTNELLEETEGLEDKKQSLQQEIQQLQMEKEDLEFILEAHKATCRLKRSDSPPDVKPFSLNANKLLLGGMPVKMDPDAPEAKRPRPTSLPVVPRKMINVPTTDMLGVPITTPTTGMPFNFDSLMDGGTGLTPVSGPLVPSCATQQRSGCVDLSSPDTLPTKLVCPRHLRFEQREVVLVYSAFSKYNFIKTVLVKMSTKENNAEVAVDKVTENNEKSTDAKAEVKGTKRPAEDKSEDAKKQKKEENGEEEEIEEEEEVEGEEEDEEDELPEDELDEGEEEEDEGDDGEGDDDEDDA